MTINDAYNLGERYNITMKKGEIIMEEKNPPKPRTWSEKEEALFMEYNEISGQTEIDRYGEEIELAKDRELYDKLMIKMTLQVLDCNLDYVREYFQDEQEIKDLEMLVEYWRGELNP